MRDAILDAKASGLCADLAVDAGYSLLKAESLFWPLQEAGIPITFRPASYQCNEGARIGSARVLHGQLFSQHVPEDLVDIQLPGWEPTVEEKQASIDEFERRAAYRYGRHKSPGADGTTRWKCPFHSGRLRSRDLPWSMRSRQTAPLVNLLTAETCCEGILTVGAGGLPLTQRTIVGTRAWWQDMGRRAHVETGNSRVHVGGYMEIDKGYVRLLDSGRIDGLLAHGLGGLNRTIIKQWMRTKRLLAPYHPDALPPKQTTRKPRSGRVARFEDLPRRTKSPPPPD